MTLVVPKTDGLEWLSIVKTAEHFGVSRRTIYGWIAAKKVRTIRTPGGQQRVLVDTSLRKAAEQAQVQEASGS
jgi:excisionase family DNA binding protein